MITAACIEVTICRLEETCFSWRSILEAHVFESPVSAGLVADLRVVDLDHVSSAFDAGGQRQHPQDRGTPEEPHVYLRALSPQRCPT
jgi:hypothetical protein